jgi:hypothetical protein
MVFLDAVAKETFNRVVLAFLVFCPCCGVTVVDCWLVANGRGRKGLGSKVTQFVSYLVVTRYDKIACLALKCMADAELLQASIKM